MTTFGTVLGSWIAGVTKPGVILLAGFGACLATGVSGFFGAFMAERAERERQLKEMKETTGSRVNPLHYRAASFVVVYVALIDGLSPVLTRRYRFHRLSWLWQGSSPFQAPTSFHWHFLWQHYSFWACI